MGRPQGRDRRVRRGRGPGALDTAGRGSAGTSAAPKDWAWGRIHTIAFKESTLGVSGIGPLEWYFRHRSRRSTGRAARSTTRTTGWAAPTPTRPIRGRAVADTLGELFSVTNGPSMRALYDMGNLDAGRIVTTTGQSGQPFSGHADDWVGKWLRNETVPLPFTDPAIDKATAATLLLTPNP